MCTFFDSWVFLVTLKFLKSSRIQLLFPVLSQMRESFFSKGVFACFVSFGQRLEIGGLFQNWGFSQLNAASQNFLCSCYFPHDFLSSVSFFLWSRKNLFFMCRLENVGLASIRSLLFQKKRIQKCKQKKENAEETRFVLIFAFLFLSFSS